MSDLKYKLEALLFSSARSMKIDELANLTKASPEEIREKLEEIKKDYEQRDSSIALIDEGQSFKLNVKSEHAPVIQQIVTETELSKTLMETLAIIAFKYPIKQSDLIKLRTNKAYDHLRELEEMGYIIRQKYSRTKLIKLTPRFFEYFDLPAEKLKEKFADFGGIAKAIREKEDEVKQMKQEIKKKAEEAGKKLPDSGNPGGLGNSKNHPKSEILECAQKSKAFPTFPSKEETSEEDSEQPTPKETTEEPTEKPIESHKSKILRSKASGTTEVVSEGLETKSQSQPETTKEEPFKAEPEASAEEEKEENKQDENIPS